MLEALEVALQLLGLLAAHLAHLGVGVVHQRARPGEAVLRLPVLPVQCDDVLDRGALTRQLLAFGRLPHDVVQAAREWAVANNQ